MKERQKQPPGAFCKKCVVKDFVKFAGKYLCWSILFHKAADLRRETLLKIDSNTGDFL